MKYCTIVHSRCSTWFAEPYTCITLCPQASFYPDPTALYTHVYSKGVGHRTAALYVAWAQQLEHRGTLEQADAVYQKAVRNQAQPADTILNEYR